MRLAEKIEYVFKVVVFNYGDNYDYDEDEALEEMFADLLFKGVVKLNESVDDNGSKWRVIYSEADNAIEFYKEDRIVASESLVTKDEVVFKARVNYLLDEDKLYNLMMKYETI